MLPSVLRAKRYNLFFLAILLFLFAGSALFAAADLQIDVLVGFNGRFKPGHWTPVQVALSNRGSEIEGKIQIDVVTGSEHRGDLNSIRYEKALLLPKNSSKRYSFVLPLQDSYRPFKVSISSRGGIILEHEVDLRGADIPERIVLGLSRELSLDFLSLLSGPSVQPGDTNRIRVLYPRVEYLPEKWSGYDGIGAVVFHNTALNLKESQVEALDLWVAAGGTLVISGGVHFSAAGSSVLRSLMPVEAAGWDEIEHLTSLEKHFGSRIAAHETSIVTLSRPVTGEVLVEQDTIPLIVSEKRGKGRIFFLAFDYASHPIQSWPGKYSLWRYLLNQRDSHPYGEGTSLLTSALSVPIKVFPSHLILLGITAGYLFLLWRLTRGIHNFKNAARIIIVIALASVISVSSYYAFNTRLLREDLLFMDITLLRSTSGSGYGELRKDIAFASTHRKNYSAAFTNDTLVLDPASADGMTVIEGRELTVKNIMVDRWRSRRIRLECLLPFPSEGGIFREDGLIKMRVKNTSPWTIQDSIIFYRGIPYYIGAFRPGEEISEDFRIYRNVDSLKEELKVESYYQPEDYKSEVKLSILNSLLEHPDWDILHREDTVVLMGWIEEPLIEAKTDYHFTHEIRLTLCAVVMSLEGAL